MTADGGGLAESVKSPHAVNRQALRHKHRIFIRGILKFAGHPVPLCLDQQALGFHFCHSLPLGLACGFNPGQQGGFTIHPALPV